MFADCYMFTKILCSLCIEIHKPALSSLVHWLQTIVFLTEQHNHSPVIAWLTAGLGFLGPADSHAYLASLLAAFKLNETGKLLTF